MDRTLNSTPLPVDRAARMRRIQWLLGGLATLFTMLLHGLGAFDRVESFLIDLRVRWFNGASPGPSPDVVFASIDDQATESVQRWPWHRQQLAVAVRELTRAGAKVIALDILLDDPQPTRAVRIQGGDDADSTAWQTVYDDDELAAAIREHGNVVVAMSTPLVGPGGRAAPTGDVPTDGELMTRLVQDAALRPMPDEGAVAMLAAEYLNENERLMRGGPMERLRANWVRARIIDRHLRTDSLQIPEGLDVRWPVTSGPEPPIAPFADAARTLATVAFNTEDQDQIVRRVPALIRFQNRLWPTFSVAVTARFLGVDPSAARRVGRTLVLDRPGGGTPVVFPLEEGRTADGARAGDLVYVNWPESSTWLNQLRDRGTGEDRIISLGYVMRPWLTIQRVRRSIDELDRLVRSGYVNGLAEETEYEPDAGEIAAGSPGVPTFDAALKRQIERWREFARRAAELTDLGDTDPATLDETQQSQLKAMIQIARRVPLAMEQVEQGCADALAVRARLGSALAGKIVFVGSSFTAAVADFVSTSISPPRTPGAMVHAALCSAALTGYSRTAGPAWLDLLSILLLGLLGAFIGVRAGVVVGPVLVLSAGAAWFVVSSLAFWDTSLWIVSVAGPAVAADAAWLGVLLHRLLVEQRSRKRTEDRFRSYVSPAVVDILVNNPSLNSMAPQKRELTVMFSDVANFTTLAERLGSAKTAQLLATYLGAMTDILQQHTATVDKYLGDGIMAFWGAPLDDNEHAAHACAAAIRMMQAVERMNQEGKFGDAGPLVVRIGLASGDLMVGDFGNPPRNSSYTVIGDAANVAARLESANKIFGTRILVSPRTRELASWAGGGFPMEASGAGGAAFTKGAGFRWRPIGQVRVKGKEEPEYLYELVGDSQGGIGEGGALPHAPRTDEWINATKHAVNLYQRRDLAGAHVAFTDLNKRFGDRALAEAYCSAIVHWQARPDRDEAFDGTIQLADK